MRTFIAILLLTSVGCGATSDQMRAESALPSTKAKQKASTKAKQKGVEPQPGTTAQNERARKLVLADISLVETAAAAAGSPVRRSKLASRLSKDDQNEPIDDVDRALPPPKPKDGAEPREEERAPASTVSDRAVLDMVRVSIVSHLGAIATCFDEQAQVDSLMISASVTEQGGLSNISVQTPSGGSAATLCTATELRKLRIANYEHGRRKVVLKLQFQPAN